MKIASFILPHTGGTWVAATGLADGLEAWGISLKFLGSGPAAAAAWTDPAYARYQSRAEVVAPRESDDRRRAAALLGALRDGGFDGAIIDVLSDIVPAGLVRHLPASLVRVMVVHSITPGTYAVALRVAPHVHATVAISPRMAQDLGRAAPRIRDRIRLIPHGLPHEWFQPSVAERSADGLAVLFLGRIEDSAKNVFLIPEILRRCGVSRLRVTIAGDGPDLPALRAQSAGLPVTFLGAVSRVEARMLLSSHHALIMPSRYEGLSFGLMEAMALGCLPVAARISGVTDFLVEHGESGWLFPVGDAEAAARALQRIGDDPALIGRLAAGARRRAQAFRQELTAARYAELLMALSKERPNVPSALPMSAWRLPTGGIDRLRASLPNPVKNTLRLWRERWRSRS